MMNEPQPFINSSLRGFSEHRFIDSIDFYVAAETYECHIEFKSFKIVSFGETGEAMFEGADDGSFPMAGWTNDPNEASVFMSGYVKWDGCSDIRFDEQDRCMLHFCGRKQASRIGLLIGEVYKIAESLLHDKWDSE